MILMARRDGFFVRVTPTCVGTIHATLKSMVSYTVHPHAREDGLAVSVIFRVRGWLLSYLADPRISWSLVNRGGDPEYREDCANCPEVWVECLGPSSVR